MIFHRNTPSIHTDCHRVQYQQTGDTLKLLCKNPYVKDKMTSNGDNWFTQIHVLVAAKI